MTTTAPYGTWESPITAEHAAAAGGGPGWARLAGGRAWWTEARPADNGRVAIVCATPGEEPVDVLPPGWNARNRVHEYGGFPFAIAGDSAGEYVVFTHWDDQRLYRCAVGGTPTPLTPEPERPHGFRYAELVTAADGAEVWCIRETITGDTPTDVRRELVAVAVDGGPTRVLAASHHFMSAPRPSQDGTHAAWIGWDHPAMPWDGTELCVAEVRDGVFGEHRVVAGGPAESVCQFEWDGPRSLVALTDPDGWWNLHRIGIDGDNPTGNLAPVATEIGGALWRPGQTWFAPLGGGRHAVLLDGRLAVLDETAGLIEVPAPGFDWWGSTLTAENGRILCTAGGPQREAVVVTADLSTVDGQVDGEVELVELSVPADVPDPALLPRPVELMFATPDGATVPAYVYPPTNPDYRASDGERPPYIVHVHGGPTSRSVPVLDMEIAFFTSRGFGVVAPNYGGSTGFGRAFRERLREEWGVVDVADCAAVAQALAADGTADPKRLIIRGGSAGGWTTAASLTVEGGSVYRCGTAMYPILDLLRWTGAGAETHDFESQYLHSLVGPLPQTHDRYVDRSPNSHPERLSGPILLLQGLDDQICPPAQAERLVAALAGSGVPHAYLAFDGEQHGFRKAESIIAALNAELAFYGQVLGFATPGVPQLELSS